MEFRTEVVAADLQPPRIDWPVDVRSGDIRRVTVIDEDGYDGRECFTDFALSKRDAYELAITLRPLEPALPPSCHDDIHEKAFERLAQKLGELRYRTMPSYLAGIDYTLSDLDPRVPRLLVEPLPSDRWTYLPSESHFDYRVRASRTFPADFFPPEVRVPDIVDFLVSHDCVLTYSAFSLTVEYQPRS
jgi:hypothetical protein